jgi:predicted metallo-beta-lactamase superfamily hydrolase
VGFLVLLHGFDQFLNLSAVGKVRQQGLKNLRLASGRAEAAVLVDHHCHRKDGQQG